MIDTYATAVLEWRQIKGGRFAELRAITQPTLVANGSNDIMVPTINSWIMSQQVPNAQLIVYPMRGMQRTTNIQSCF
jgi:pimeloyl-ACP methyl ester carboxylesterase